jgi:hypothetical protein
MVRNVMLEKVSVVNGQFCDDFGVVYYGIINQICDNGSGI